MAARANPITRLVRQKSWNTAPVCLTQNESRGQAAQSGTQKPAEDVLVILILLHLEVGFFELINLAEDFFQRLGVDGSEENTSADSRNFPAGVFFERHIFL